MVFYWRLEQTVAVSNVVFWGRPSSAEDSSIILLFLFNFSYYYQGLPSSTEDPSLMLLFLFHFLGYYVLSGRPFFLFCCFFFNCLGYSVFSGRPFCYFILSISLFLLLRHSVSKGRQSWYSTVSFSFLGSSVFHSSWAFSHNYFFSHKFCAQDFSKTALPIFMKHSDLIVTHLNLKPFFFNWWRHSWFWDFDVLAIFRGSVWPRISS